MSRLRRSCCGEPGISRIPRGRGFEYRDAAGRRIDDAELLERITALAIPPAWTQVWICPHPNGHLQAVGTDDAGRRQYLYHPQWREKKDVLKHQRILELAQRLPQAREQAAHHLAARKFARTRALAAAFTILDLTSIRVGSEQYAVRHATYGLATLLREHAHTGLSYVDLQFRGKGSQLLQLHISHRRLARVVSQLLERNDPSPRLLAWQADGLWHPVSSTDINGYVSELTDGPFTAKDFRTWNATVLMALELARRAEQEPTDTVRQRRLITREAIAHVAAHLGNTPTVARNSYISPTVIDLFNDGVVLSPDIVHEPVPSGRLFSPAAESAVATILRDPRRAERLDVVEHLAS